MSSADYPTDSSPGGGATPLASAINSKASKESGVSPRSQSAPNPDQGGDSAYFPQADNSSSASSNAPPKQTKPDAPRIRIKGADSLAASESPALSRHSSVRSDRTVTRPRIEIPERPVSGSGVAAFAVRPGPGRARQSSISSLSFKAPHDPALPQGTHKKTDKSRIKESSPPPNRFQSRVAFDNIPIGDATKHNTPSLTLNVRHMGYQAKRRSRTFMAGVDEHAYSDYALQWLLDELVDDGDEVICVRVIESTSRATATYQQDARRLMDSIIAKNGSNRAISVVLEYACGRLHSTFQKLIQVYQPSMLIVGTRGRSLGGLQGLVNTRNSFSKYCLQYSPIPVVVVRPTEKREKKKSKRMNDSERQTYAKMLTATGGKHEADSERSSMYEVETKYTADEEASQVAKVLGLPASFDPTIKPLNTASMVRTRQSEPSPLSTETTQQEAASAEPPSQPEAAGDSEPDDDDDEDDDEEEEEGEFEVLSGEQMLDRVQQERLHSMEVGEAAALLKQNRRMSADSAIPEEEEEKKGPRGSLDGATKS